MRHHECFLWLRGDETDEGAFARNGEAVYFLIYFNVRSRDSKSDMERCVLCGAERQLLTVFHSQTQTAWLFCTSERKAVFGK